MYNAYPGGQDNEAARLDEFVYRRIAEVLGIGGSKVVFDPESTAAQQIQARTRAMVDKGMDPYRVAVVSAMAQIDSSDAMYLRRQAALEDISDH